MHPLIFTIAQILEGILTQDLQPTLLADVNVSMSSINYYDTPRRGSDGDSQSRRNNRQQRPNKSG